jgi:hypothetical protein
VEKKEKSSQQGISAFISEGLLIGRHRRVKALEHCYHLPKPAQSLQFYSAFFLVLQTLAGRRVCWFGCLK